MVENAERATLLLAVAAATGAFAIAFNFGAFDAVFFDTLLSVWVIATIVLVGSLVSSLPPRGWLGRLVLLTPTVWVVVAFVADPAGQDAIHDVLYIASLIVTLVTLPVIAWVLVVAIRPDFLELPRANRIAVLAAVGVSAVVGFGMGARNDVFLNCDDFKVSGSDLPANCTPVPTTANPGQ